MIRPRVRSILQDSGFELCCNEWIGDFVDDNSGMLINIVAKEGADENDCPQVLFHAFDESGNLLGIHTLDQLLDNLEMGLTPVPKKSDKKYQAIYRVKIQVPVEMQKVDNEKYRKIFCEDGLSDESGIAESIARKALASFLRYCPFNVVGMEAEEVEEI